MNQKSFVEFLFRNQVILLGDFITKSRRRTPYFFNFGQINTGASLYRLGYFYAKKIWECVENRIFPTPTVIYGPAYKGIPLAVSTVIGLKGRGEIGYAFNRKEVKDHGDGGVVVGKTLGAQDRVVVIDDVVTSGLSLEESIRLIQNDFRAKVVGVVVAVDREELAEKSLLKKKVRITASEHIVQNYGIPVKAIMKLNEIFSLAKKYQLISQKDFLRVTQYLQENHYENN